MVQVRPCSRVCAFRSDLTCFQLTALSRLVSSRGLCRSLRHACHLVSHHIRRIRHHSGASNRSRRLSTPSARLYGLLAYFFDVACSFHRRTRSGRYWDLFHHIRRPRQPLRGPDRPRRLSTPPACPYHLLVLHLGSTRSFRRRARFPGIWGLLGRCGSCLVRPFRRMGLLAPLEFLQVSFHQLVVLSACAGLLTRSIASSDSPRCSRHALALAMRPLRCPGRLSRLESFQVSSSDFFDSSVCARVLTR